MAKREFLRNLMLSAGILAVVVILCSQAFQKEATSLLAKIKTEQSDKAAGNDKKVIIATPADAVTSGQAVEVGDALPNFIREIVADEDKDTKLPVIDKTILGDFVTALLRVVISPQAP